VGTAKVRRNIALLIEYDGTAYCGWQVQENGRSIQAVIEKTLSELLQESTKIVGAGRTDAGVHAFGQVANFHTRSEWAIEKIVYALNGTLPHDIAVRRGAIVPNGFHSRFDALKRKYVYRIATRKSPLVGHFAACFHFDLSLELMNKAASFLIGERSFKSFTKYADQQRHFICNVMEADWTERDGGRRTENNLEFRIEANRFLHGMVRAIVGTLVDVGRGKISIDDFKRIIEMEKRSYASMSAPACGLFLAEVKYGLDIWGELKNGDRRQECGIRGK
jgi:tRNA pseudouridine38-40 synthase